MKTEISLLGHRVHPTTGSNWLRCSALIAIPPASVTCTTAILCHVVFHPLLPVFSFAKEQFELFERCSRRFLGVARYCRDLRYLRVWTAYVSRWVWKRVPNVALVDLVFEIVVNSPRKYVQISACSFRENLGLCSFMLPVAVAPFHLLGFY